VLIGGLQRFSLCDYPGRVAAVVFTQGCNFRCPFCHNGHLLSKSGSGPMLDEGEVLDFLARRKKQLGGVVVSGGEPTLQDDLAGFVGAIKELGLAVKLDTNGSRPEVLERLVAASLVDYIAMDVKAPLAKYDRLCGTRVDTAAVRASIDLIGASGIPHHFRTTFVEALLDAEDLFRVRELVPPASQHVVQPFCARSALDETLRQWKSVVFRSIENGDADAVPHPRFFPRGR